MKYVMTDEGFQEFITNKRLYLLPTVRAKLMSVLSVRIGYTSDSLVSQVTSDPRLKASALQAIVEIHNLKNVGYIEERD